MSAKSEVGFRHCRSYSLAFSDTPKESFPVTLYTNITDYKPEIEAFNCYSGLDVAESPLSEVLASYCLNRFFTHGILSHHFTDQPLQEHEWTLLFHLLCASLSYQQEHLVRIAKLVQLLALASTGLLQTVDAKIGHRECVPPPPTSSSEARQFSSPMMVNIMPGFFRQNVLRNLTDAVPLLPVMTAVNASDDTETLLRHFVYTLMPVMRLVLLAKGEYPTARVNDSSFWCVHWLVNFAFPSVGGLVHLRSENEMRTFEKLREKYAKIGPGPFQNMPPFGMDCGSDFCIVMHDNCGVGLRSFFDMFDAPPERSSPAPQMALQNALYRLATKKERQFDLHWVPTIEAYADRSGFVLFTHQCLPQYLLDLQKCDIKQRSGPYLLCALAFSHPDLLKFATADGVEYSAEDMQAIHDFCLYLCHEANYATHSSLVWRFVHRMFITHEVRSPLLPELIWLLFFIGANPNRLSEAEFVKLPGLNYNNLKHLLVAEKSTLNLIVNDTFFRLCLDRQPCARFSRLKLQMLQRFGDNLRALALQPSEDELKQQLVTDVRVKDTDILYSVHGFSAQVQIERENAAELMDRLSDETNVQRLDHSQADDDGYDSMLVTVCQEFAEVREKEYNRHAPLVDSDDIVAAASQAATELKKQPPSPPPSTHGKKRPSHPAIQPVKTAKRSKKKEKQPGKRKGRPPTKKKEVTESEVTDSDNDERLEMQQKQAEEEQKRKVQIEAAGIIAGIELKRKEAEAAAALAAKERKVAEELAEKQRKEAEHKAQKDREAAAAAEKVRKEAEAEKQKKDQEQKQRREAEEAALVDKRQKEAKQKEAEAAVQREKEQKEAVAAAAALLDKQRKEAEAKIKLQKDADDEAVRKELDLKQKKAVEEAALLANQRQEADRKEAHEKTLADKARKEAEDKALLDNKQKEAAAAALLDKQRKEALIDAENKRKQAALLEEQNRQRAEEQRKEVERDLSEMQKLRSDLQRLDAERQAQNNQLTKLRLDLTVAASTEQDLTTELRKSQKQLEAEKERYLKASGQICERDTTINGLRSDVNGWKQKYETSAEKCQNLDVLLKKCETERAAAAKKEKADPNAELYMDLQRRLLETEKHLDVLHRLPTISQELQKDKEKRQRRGIPPVTTTKDSGGLRAHADAHRS